MVHDDKGHACGFVMKKLAGYVPLHMIFSPMDRKKLFPDKGYNFLVHVARNLATAFFNLHEAGLVVGDVNEGNILISSSGLVAFIDCDSFQVKGPDQYFFCEVGVPRYTPPELLTQVSFQQIVRTVNTDSFSLAVLLFQLLFLGRHPFAGRHKGVADFDEETAIRNREFAYSLDNKKKKLSPPNDSFPITNLPGVVVTLFHQAFEHDARPAPAEWVKALDALLADMVTCAASSLHTYPAGLSECPWCYFKQKRGILYFLDDSYLHAANQLADIESFVNGFHLEQMGTKKWAGTTEHKDLTAAPIAERFLVYRALRMGVTVAAALVPFLLYLFNGHNAMLGTCSVWLPFFIYHFSPWTSKLRAEAKRRKKQYADLTALLNAMITEHDHSPDIINYTNSLNTLNKLVHDFRRLPDEFERRKKAMEEQVYNDQLSKFLSGFDIERHGIPSFGTVKKAALYSNGIRTAADIARVQSIKIPGIGPKNIQVLLSWQRQMAAEFIYIPDYDTIDAGMRQVNNEIAQIKMRLEHLIRKEYQSANYVKQNIANRSNVLALQITEVSARAYQAGLDMNAFRKFYPNVKR